MAWMIVLREGNFRRPGSRLSFNFKPSAEPQQWPRDVVDNAVANGFAKRSKSPSRAGEQADTSARVK